MNRIVKLNNFVDPISTKEIKFKINTLYAGNKIMPLSTINNTKKCVVNNTILLMLRSKQHDADVHWIYARVQIKKSYTQQQLKNGITKCLNILFA